MATYKVSRNIEASIIDYLTSYLESGWTNINIEKSFARIYTISLPSVCVRVGDSDYDPAEIGSTDFIRSTRLFIDIFGDSMGLTLDLKDSIIFALKDGCPYYEYVIEKGQVKTKTQNGRLTFLNLADSGVNFDIDKDKLDVHDRNRWLINCDISRGKVE